MKAIIYILTILFFSSNAIAQFSADTIFLDKAGLRCNKRTATSYRLYQQEGENKFLVEDYYMNGVIKMKGNFISIYPEYREGKFSWYNDKGELTDECSYEMGYQEGEYKKYENNKLECLMYCKKGVLDGELTSFFNNGQIRRIENYLKGEFVSGKCYSTTGKDTTYYKRRIDAEFVGGFNNFAKYLSNNIVYPKKAKELGIEGKVYIGFVINEEGNVENVKVIKGIGAGCDEEAFRIIKKMPAWNPGKFEGQTIKMSFTIPIEFKLN